MAKPEPTFTPDPVDIHVGQRLRLRRNMVGMSQDELATACDITFQQIQKYETAVNRISASRLFQIGMALKTPVAFFFEGLPNQTVIMDDFSPTKSKRRGLHVSEPSENDPLTRNESLKLINLFWKLPNDSVRDNVFAIMENLSKKLPQNA